MMPVPRVSAAENNQSRSGQEDGVLRGIYFQMRWTGYPMVGYLKIILVGIEQK